jgi:hypothetical protein
MKTGRDKKEDVGLVPNGNAAKSEKIKNTYATTIITGEITYIKLAVKPNFLPDSSDTLNPRIQLCGDFGISFSITYQPLT